MLPCGVPNTTTRLASLFLFVPAALAFSACGGGTPTFPVYAADAGLQCSADGPAPPPVTGDAGTDASMVDSGAVDGAVDSGAVDSGAVDSGAVDSGAVDSGTVDSGTVDSGAVDSGAVDSGADDGGAVDASTPPVVDAGPVLPRCPEGQLCLDHRCYFVCRSDDDCAAAEQCDSDGACVPRTRPRTDAGPRDSGPPDPCATVTCSGATPACNPLLAACQPCGLSLAAGDTACDARTQVCEVARGQCSAFDITTLAVTCGPCNTDADCADGATCLTRGAPEAVERVCVPACDLATPCPQGLECDARGVCLPSVGSCFEYRAAADGRGCDAVDKCAPIGASTDHVECHVAGAGVGLCETVCTAATDCAPGLDCFAGFCHRPTPCAASTDCATGLECGADSFCHPLPSM